MQAKNIHTFDEDGPQEGVHLQGAQVWRPALPHPLYVGFRLRKAQCICGKVFGSLEAYQAHYIYQAVWQNESNYIPDLLAKGQMIDSNTSDGYHTFDELYRYRMLYNAALFNEWAKQHKYRVHKSWKHSNGESCFGGGWFIAVAELPTGQITNHYRKDDWGLFSVPERALPLTFDGHTPQDVATRMMEYLSDTNERSI